MSYLRRWGADVGNFAAWSAHLFAFGPEPPTQATWRCPKCKRRHPTARKRCCS